MKISLFAVIAAVAAIAVASPVPVSPQSVDYPSFKPADVTALYPENEAIGMVLHKRGNTFGHLARYWGFWTGAKVAAGTVASYFQTQFSSQWVNNHILLEGYWQWYTTLTMTNGSVMQVGAFIKDGYIMSADDVSSYVNRAVEASVNKIQGLDWGIYNTGDDGKIQRGYITVHEE